MNNSNLIILTFVVTALWDVALRYMALNFDYFLIYKNITMIN